MPVADFAPEKLPLRIIPTKNQLPEIESAHEEGCVWGADLFHSKNLLAQRFTAPLRSKRTRVVQFRRWMTDFVGRFCGGRAGIAPEELFDAGIIEELRRDSSPN